jgi:hypothetical protein
MANAPAGLVAAARLKMHLLAAQVGKDDDTGLLVMPHYCAVCAAARFDGEGDDGEGDCIHKQALRQMEVA